MKNMEIKFNVKDYFDEQLRTSAKALGLVNALMRVDMSENDFWEKIENETKEKVKDTLGYAIKNTQEINENETVIKTINDMLKGLRSNLRLKQYISTTKDLSIRNRVYLIGNGYFRWIYQLSDIQIPDKDYYGWEMEDEYKSELKKGYLYITEENELIKIDLSKNIDDEIDYTGSYLETISQVLLRNKITSRQDFVGVIDIESKDKKVDASIDTDDICDLFLIAHGQDRTDRWDSRYEISVEELNSIVEQIKLGGNC